MCKRQKKKQQTKAMCKKQKQKKQTKVMCKSQKQKQQTKAKIELSPPANNKPRQCTKGKN